MRPNRWTTFVCRLYYCCQLVDFGILTSVVSDNMIRTSVRTNLEDEKQSKEDTYAARVVKLKTLFNEIDTDGSGMISSDEWSGMMQDRGLRYAFCMATGLGTEDLNEYFSCLAKGPFQQRVELESAQAEAQENKWLFYDDFIAALKDYGEVADKVTLMRMSKRIVDLELAMIARLEIRI